MNTSYPTFFRLYPRLRRAAIGLLIVVTLLVTLLPAAGAVSTPADSGPATANAPDVPSPPVTRPGIYAVAEDGTMNPSRYHLVGSLRTFNWSELHTGPNQYNWAGLDQWLNTVAQNGKAAAIGITTYNGRCCGGISALPSWIRTTYPNTVIAAGACNASQFPQGGCVNGQWYLPRYWDADYLNLYGQFIQALGDRYKNDPRVEWVAMGFGTFGENHAANTASDLSALTNAGLTTDLWISTMQQVIDRYADAFRSVGVLQKMPMIQVASFTYQTRERWVLSNYAAARGIGLSFNGLTPDFNNAVQGAERCNTRNECGMYDPIFEHNRTIPIAFETYQYMICDTTNVYWAMLSGLDKRADFLRLNYDLFYDPVTHQDRTENLAIFDWTARYVGKSVANTPSAWVALREHRIPTRFCYAQPETSAYYPQLGNYNFYLTQDDNVPGGRTVPETNDSTVTHFGCGGSWCLPGSPYFTGGYNAAIPAGRQGWVVRRTDQATGNHSMWFKVDDGYINGGANQVIVSVTYADMGNDRWALKYDGPSGEQTAIPEGSGNPWVQKTGSNTWKTATFRINDARFANGLSGGSDFRIDSLGDGNEWVHLVDVARQGGPIPPTSTPVNTPTPPPGATATPTPTITPTTVPTVPPPSAGSWTLQWHGSDDLNDIDFVTPQIGWAVGKSGHLMRTTNGGESWFFQQTSPAVDVEAVDFIDSNLGWLVGAEGRIWSSANGGATWALQTTPTMNRLTRIAMVDSQTGWAVGRGGVVLRTIDGGAHWIQQTSGTGLDLLGLAVVDAQNAWAVGANGTVVTTSNGGANWATRASGTTNWLWDVTASGAQTGWAVGDGGKLLFTNDGGLSWYSRSINEARPLRAVAFASAQQGWIAGGQGTLWFTLDGGTTWSYLGTDQSETITALSAPQAGTVWAAGFKHTVLRSQGGGAFTRRAPAAVGEFKAVDAIDANTAYVVGDSGMILKTTDAGLSWRQLSSPATGWLKDVKFPVDASTGWVIGQYGTVLRTTDGGSSWTPQALPDAYTGYLWAIDAWDNTRANIAAGGSRVYRTTTAGASWQLADAPGDFNMLDINYGTADAVYATSWSDTFFTSHNNGASWIRRYPGAGVNLNSVDFRNELLGWVVGNNGTIIRSTNAGDSWTTQASGTGADLNGASFVDDYIGWAVGNGGTIRWTVNAGNNWAAQTSPVLDNLLHVDMVDAYDGWAVGANGTIIKYHAVYVPPPPTPTPTATNTPTPTATPTATATNTPAPGVNDGTIAGHVFVDGNGNGKWEPGESTLAGAVVTVSYVGGSQIDVKVTGPDGHYAFYGLAPGQYDVRETDPPGYTSPPASNLQTVTVYGGEVTVHDFADTAVATATPTPTSTWTPTATPSATATPTATPPTGRVYGTVYNDGNSNGVFDPGELGIPGVTITLYQGTTVIGTRTTANDGTYEFATLAPGQYRVEETDPPGHTSTTPNTVVLFLSAGANLEINFGDHGTPTPAPTPTPSTGAVGGLVWNDLNGNIEYDPGEPVLNGVLVTIKTLDNQTVGSATTGLDGRYRVADLAPGNYRAEETDPPGYASPLGSPNQVLFQIVAGQETTVNFADILVATPTPTPNPAAGRVYGRVWNDLNRNAVPDPGEPGIEDVTITLLRDTLETRVRGPESVIVATTRSDANGEFNFYDVVPGPYFVEETDRPQHQSVTPNTVYVLVVAGQQYPVYFGDYIDGRMVLPQIGNGWRPFSR